MQDTVITVRPDTLRSPLTRAAAWLYALSCAAGIPVMAALFSSHYTSFLIQDLAASGISNPSSLLSWYIIGRLIAAVACLGSAVMAVFLFIGRRRPVRGYGGLATAAKCLLYAVTGGGILLIPVFLFRFFRYIILNSDQPSGVMAIFSMILMEGLMVVLAAFLFFMARRFLNSCIDSAASISYTLATSKLDNRSIPGLSATGFLILAILCIVLVIDRMFTLTIVVQPVQSYYKLLVSRHPVQIAEALSLLSGAAANFLTYQALRRYKRLTELALFNARKAK